METLSIKKKNQMSKTLKEMNGFGGFINRPHKMKKKPVSLKKCQQKLPKPKCKEKKKRKSWNRISKNCGKITKVYTHAMGIPEGEERRNQTEEIFEIIMIDHFLK